MSKRSGDDVARALKSREPIEFFEDDSDDEVDFVYHDESSLNLDSDESDKEEETRVEETATSEETPSRKYLYGKNGHKWWREAPQRREGKFNFHLPGLKYGCQAESQLDHWNLLFSNSIVDVISRYTNAEIDRFKDPLVLDPDGSFKNIDGTFKNVGRNELLAYLGLLYFMGLQKSGDVSITELWSDEFSSFLHRSVMSEERFQFLSARLCFDDKLTRSHRRQFDNLAPIREIWDLFVNNCQRCYVPSESMTIDEQFLNFQGKFNARVYDPTKRSKYGIKIVSLNDSKTHYMYNAIAHCGRVLSEAGESVGNFYVRKLCEPIYQTGRTVTTNGRFTSIETFDKMGEKNILMVGTIGRNKRDVPSAFRANAFPNSIRYAYDGKNVLVSYCPRRSKVIVALSSLHETGETSQDSMKPEIIEFYDKTRGAVEIFESQCDALTCARNTRRWTMRFFMGMLDQASVNGCILYNFAETTREMQSRRDFLKILIRQMLLPHLRDRLQDTNLSRNIISHIREFIHEANSMGNLTGSFAPEEPVKLGKRKRCGECPKKRDRKTLHCCTKCQLPLCDDHRLSLCTACFRR